MQYNIGLVFRNDKDYHNKARFCNKNGLRIVEIEPDIEGRRFQIQEVPKPSKEEILNELRLRREIECFSIVNRGQVWYENLTDLQKEEIKIWYRNWLDVTLNYIQGINTESIIPKKPTWLK